MKSRRPHAWPAPVIRMDENKGNKGQGNSTSVRSSLGFVLCVLLVLCSCLTTASSQAWDGVFINQADYRGLQAFRHALYDPRGVLRSWNDTGHDACSGAWAGIKCVKGKVVAIHLPWRSLGGRITEMIGQLSALRKLSLHDNSIGGQIPTSIGLLTDLRGLYLFNNRFSGTIPSSIGNCIMLQTIDLSNNLLVGSIPSSIANSTKLYRINLSYNNLSSIIPVTVTQSSSLAYLLLNHNNLTGSIPETWGAWKGTTNSGHVYQLQTLSLDHNFLTGRIPSSLCRLQKLRELTLSNNMLNGVVPEEFGNLSVLQKLDLSENSLGGSIPSSLCNLSSLVQLTLDGNRIDGKIPEAIDGLKNLSLLSLKGNQLAGEIPATVGNISGLTLLDMSNNNLTGEIPVSLTKLTRVTFLNVSNNNLSGQVPLLLSGKFNASSFRGNLQLCGYSTLNPCPSPPPHPNLPLVNKERHGANLSTKNVILVVSGVILAVLLLLCCVLLCCLIRKRSALRRKSKGAEKPGAAARVEAETTREVGGKLVHFEGLLAFTPEDLLCATAEIMGKSTYGTVYKATLEDGNQVTVKRLREKITKNQKEFEAEVGDLGKVRHENLLALRAYYLGPNGEKLLVFDYMPKGSLAAFLHARGPDAHIGWRTRMNIAKGIARGLGYIHNELKAIHGNLTSSNILLDENTNPKITDYGLSRLVTAAAGSTAVATESALGYRAPELSKIKKPDTETDVYSLGVIILELLTGKAPGDMTNGMDLPQWVASGVKEEWTNEVFDLELTRDAAGTAGDEMLSTLKLALHCVDPSPTARPEVSQVLQQLQEIGPDDAAGFSEECGSAGSTAAASASND